MFEDQIAQFPPNPPRAAGLLPGLRLASAVSRSSLMIPLFFVVIFSLMPFSFFFSDPHARLSLGHTETITGRVVAIAPSGCRGEGHKITYAFAPPNGTEYRATSSACRGSPYFDVASGDHVPVTYLTSDPSINTIAGESDVNAPPFFIFLFFPLFGLLIFLPFVPQIREVFRARRRFQKGVIAKGTVVFVKRKTSFSFPGWPGANAAEVFITYTAASGTAVEAKAFCNNDWLLNHLPPGTMVNIAYMANRPDAITLLDAYIR